MSEVNYIPDNEKWTSRVTFVFDTATYFVANYFNGKRYPAICETLGCSMSYEIPRSINLSEFTLWVEEYVQTVMLRIKNGFTLELTPNGNVGSFFTEDAIEAKKELSVLMDNLLSDRLY